VGPDAPALLDISFCPGAGRGTRHWRGGRRSSARRRGELATFLVRGLGLPPASADYFTDDTGSVHEASINALAEAGIASGCGTGLYCPTAAVLRGPLASFLHRAFD
jgi:hypothetical protein